MSYEAVVDPATGKVRASLMPPIVATLEEIRAYYLNRAYILLGSAAPLDPTYNDWKRGTLLGGGTIPECTVVANIGTTSLSYPSATQHVARATAGTPASSALVCSVGTANLLATGMNTVNCYLATRFAVTSLGTGGATMFAGFGIRDGVGTQQAFIGHDAASSLVNWVLHFGTTVQDTGLALDANPHVWEMYSLAGRLYPKKDEVDVVNIAFGGAWGSPGLQLFPLLAGNGTNVVAETLEENFYLFAAPGY